MAKKFYSGIDLASQKGVNFADPTNPADAATKSYVDNLLAGLRWKAPVRVATTTNGTLASAFANGQTVDGVTLVTGDRILIKDQSSGAENGVYVVAASGAPTRATDADSTAELHGMTVMVTSGTANGDKAFTQTADNPTVGSTALVFVQVGGGSSYTADGNGLELSGTTFALELDGATLSKGSSGLKLNSAVAGAGLGISGDVLAVNVGGGLEIATDTVQIASSAAGAGLTLSAGVLAVGQGTGISVAADAVAVDTSVVVRKYATDSPSLTAGTPATITHNLNTRDVQVKIYEGTSGTAPEVEMDVNVTGVNTVTVTSAGAQSAAAFRIVVQG